MDLIEGQNADRLDWLLPVRRARMSASPFAFFRGAARIMATDLATGPHSGLTVQLCGDAHLANFGVYASPERTLVFDLNDFDETLPGPFEWDVKRLAASFAIAGEHRSFSPATCRRLALEASRAYRTAMAQFAERDWLDMWYATLPFEEIVELAETQGISKKRLKRGRKFIEKAKSKDHLQAAEKLVESTSQGLRFRNEPPLLVPLRMLAPDVHPESLRTNVDESVRSYRQSLGGEMQRLFDRYRLVDVAVKVVGVGSVGTRCSVGLFVERHPADIVLLQIKEATRSVLEEHLPESRYRLHGRRVVEGQRLMQAWSDIFLGWSKSVTGRDYYWRQLKDWKGSADLDRGSKSGFAAYARLCAFALARAHAVSGDPAAISGYLGRGSVFDDAMGEFAMRYATQNRADYDLFAAAIAEGRLEAAELEA